MSTVHTQHTDTTSQERKLNTAGHKSCIDLSGTTLNRTTHTHKHDEPYNKQFRSKNTNMSFQSQNHQPPMTNNKLATSSSELTSLHGNQSVVQHLEAAQNQTPIQRKRPAKSHLAVSSENMFPVWNPYFDYSKLHPPMLFSNITISELEAQKIFTFLHEKLPNLRGRDARDVETILTLAANYMNLDQRGRYYVCQRANILTIAITQGWHVAIQAARPVTSSVGVLPEGFQVPSPKPRPSFKKYASFGWRGRGRGRSERSESNV